MFHRVKSEDQVEGTAPHIQSQQEAQAEQAVDIQKEEAPSRVETVSEKKTEAAATSTSSISQSQLQTTEEKDTKEMTEQQNSAPEQEEAGPAGMSPYQRPGQAPIMGASAGGYPGAYPGSVSSSSEASSSDRRLTIGPGITMSGEIESCDYLLVEGTVEAALKGANLLEVAERGVFYGTVEISEANISGRFEGDITVNGRLTITSTGTVTGSISYKEIEIEAGAVIEGKLTPLSGSSAASESPAKKPQAAKAAKPAPGPKVEKQPAPANTDEGLFSKAAAAGE